MSKIRQGAAFNLISQVIDQALQFLVPIFLIRLLDADQFADYRIFWLVVGTCMLLGPLGLPYGLQYFIPRLDNSKDRATLVGQTLLLLLISGVLTGLAVYFLAPWLPEHIRVFLSSYQTITLVFLVLWVTGAATDTLANAHQDYTVQFLGVSSLAILRAALILGLAFTYRDIQPVFFGLVALAVFRLGFALVYTICRDGWHIAGASLDNIKRQFAYSVPFGLSSGLYSLRKYGEQWVVVSLFSTQNFVAFSFAATAVLPVMLIQSAIGSTLLSRLNDLHQQGQFEKLLELNKKANLVSGLFVFPAIVFLFVFAPEIVELLYTATYLDAVPVIRIYLFQVLLGVDVGSLCSVYGMGKFMLRFAGSMLLVSLPLSYLGGSLFGLTGAAYGSLLASMLAACIQYSAVASVVGVSLRQLQHWRALFSTLTIAILAILPIVQILSTFNVDHLFLRLVCAATTYGLIYLAVIIMTGRHKVLTA